MMNEPSDPIFGPRNLTNELVPNMHASHCLVINTSCGHVQYVLRIGNLTVFNSMTNFYEKIQIHSFIFHMRCSCKALFSCENFGLGTVVFLICI